MKTKLPFFLLALALFAGLTPAARAAVAFTVTPATTSNTYSGPVTLQVTGLTNAETVVVQKFLDVNANGTIDAGDQLWQQFKLTDGQAGMVIGGVTNINVPGDTDGSANSQITARLNFQADFAQTLVGKYVFRLSSPGGHFTAITKSFTVTNFPFTQKFTGTVASNGVAVPNAAVILFQGSGNSLAKGNLTPVGGAVANNSGVYTIAAPAGTYMLTAFRTNFIADSAAAANLVLGSGATLNTNLNLMAAPRSISGKVVDAANASLGLPGLLVPVLTQEGLLAVCFTDTNGNFTAQVSSNRWYLQNDSSGPAFLGYVTLQNGMAVDTTTGSVSGVTMTMPKATALFYGTLKDNLGNPLPATVAIGAGDNNYGLYQADGYTDANGNYVTAAIGGLGADDPWQVQVDNSSSHPNYIFSQPAFDQNGGTNIAVGQAVPANFTAILATSQITGQVQFEGGPVPNVQIFAYANIGGVDYSAQVDTDAGGNYSLNVANGNWSVSVSCQGGNDSLDNVLGNGNYLCPDNQNVNIAGSNETANFTVQSCAGVQIITSSPLPSAQQGNAYYLQLQAVDCDNNYVWSLNDPTNFPSGLGLSFDPAGEIFGTPTGSGAFAFSVHVDDGNGHATDTNLLLTITPATSPLQITTTSLTNGTIGVPYNALLSATGGQAPYNWSLAAVSQPLPPGLDVQTYYPLPGLSIGSVAGLPTATGRYQFTVEVTDANSATANKILSIAINPQPVLGLPAWLTNRFQMLLTGASNQNYTVQMSTNLTSTNWVTLYTTNNPAANNFILPDPNATNRQRFYRILLGP